MDNNKSKSKARVVEKINFSNHCDSDDEEDTLHYHRDNRIKATNISSEDYALFVRLNSERASESVLGSHSGRDTGHETEETRGNCVYMARARGRVRDTNEGDDEESTSSDVESEDELTERDDNSRRLRTSQLTEGKATEINQAQPPVIKGVSESAELENPDGDNVPRRSLRFHLGSSTALPERGLGAAKFFNGGRGNRKPLRSGTTGRFIAAAPAGDNEGAANTPRSATTGRFIARDHGLSRHETSTFEQNLDRTVQKVGTSSVQIYCGVCQGWVHQRWHPRCHATVERRMPVTVEISDDSDQEQKAHTVVEVVRVTNNAMTPIPHVNSDDSEGTETEDERVIVSMCCQCGERVPIQMKENGSCHDKCYFCKKNEEHLVCSAVNPDIMKDDIPHSWCDRCHNYVPSRTLANGSCHGACRYCVSRVIHDICNPAIPMTRNYISRSTQHYGTVEEAMRVENEVIDS